MGWIFLFPHLRSIFKNPFFVLLTVNRLFPYAGTADGLQPGMLSLPRPILADLIYTHKFNIYKHT